MKASQLPFRGTLIAPENISSERTSCLIERGPLVYFKNPGLGYFTPMGCIVYDKLSTLITNYHQIIGGMKVQIPNYMRRETLGCGEEVQEHFQKKFAMLPEPMAKYMILTTHEMEFLEWIGREPVSHISMPMKLFTPKDILRVTGHGDGILKLREFKVWAMVSLDKNLSAFRETLYSYAKICESIFGDLGIPYYKSENPEERNVPNKNFDLEYFYPCSEGDNFCLGGQRQKALSLSMGYRFNPQENPCQFIDELGQLRTPIVGTYALGLERIFYAALDNARDERGFNIPSKIRPFEKSILLFDDYEQTINDSQILYETLRRQGVPVFFDDRKQTKRKAKARFSDFIGIPEKIVVSKQGIRIIKRNSNEPESPVMDLEGTFRYLENGR
jgi:prolyl-tRNA synthetase